MKVGTRSARFFSDQAPVLRMPFFLEFYRPVVEFAEHSIEQVVQFTGLPWWLSISLITVGVRTAGSPLLILQYRAMSPMATAMPDYRFLSDIIKNSTVSGPQKLISAVSSARKINKIHNTRFTKAFGYAFLQIPQFITFVWAVRSLCARNPELATGGILWFHDLTVMDPYYILPFLSVGLTYINLQRGITPENKDWIINRIKYYVQMWLIITFPFTSQWPAVNKYLGCVLLLGDQCHIYVCTNESVSDAAGNNVAES